MDNKLKEILNDTLDIFRTNGFIDTEVLHDTQGYYFHLENDKCEVWVRSDDTKGSPSYYYEVEFELGQKEPVKSYSTNLNIFWLIGFLTYYDLMPKDYNLRM